MFTFPPIPSWDAWHPLIIHFPIALLLVAPVLVLLRILLPKQGRGLLIAAFVVMALGTIGTYIARSWLVAISAGRIFNATLRWSRESSARYTSPMPPAPIFETMR